MQYHCCNKLLIILIKSSQTTKLFAFNWKIMQSICPVPINIMMSGPLIMSTFSNHGLIMCQAHRFPQISPIGSPPSHAQP